MERKKNFLKPIEVNELKFESRDDFLEWRKKTLNEYEEKKEIIKEETQHFLHDL